MSGTLEPPIGQIVSPEALSAGVLADFIAFAEEEISAANTFSLTLANAAAGLVAPVITPNFPTIAAAPAQVTASPPDLAPIVWTSPAIPAAFTGTLNTDDLMPEPFDGSPPTLSFPTAPVFAETAPGAPGVDVSYVDPGLSVQLPTAPELMSLNVVTFSGLNLPTIDPNAIPQLTLVAPSIREYVPGAQYTSQLLTDLKSYLDNIIVNGGTGLNPSVEQAMWDRAREREALSRADALKDLDRMEELGFMLPSGAYLDARVKITTESDYANRGSSREIMIKQAELAYQSIQSALEHSIQIEGKSMDYTNAVEQRLFEATRYATEAGIAIYNAQVQAYAAYLDAYKTKVQIYTAQVQAQLALVEVYKAEVQAELAKAQINHELVAVYEAQIEASLSAIKIYEAQLDGIKTKAEIEKIKIDMYGEEVRAYAAKVNAYTAGVEGYRATIQAEGVKEDIYKTQVDAYSSLVGAAAKEIDARIATYRGQLDAWLGLWDGYKAQTAGQAAMAQAISSSNTSLVEGYRAEVAAITSYNEVMTKQWQAVIDESLQVANIGISAAKANADLYVTTRSLATDAAKVGAQVSAQLGAAALNAINWSTHYSNSNSWSSSNGFDIHFGINSDTSTNTNYNYSADI